MKKLNVGDLVIVDDKSVVRYDQLYIIIQRFTETLVRIQGVSTGNKDIVHEDWLLEAPCSSTR